MIEQLIVLQRKIKEYIQEKESFNEEETKMALILPLLQWLGYDIFNPREVKAEVPFDFKSSRGDKERVDYGLVINGHTRVIIEAKPFLDKLTNAHMAQLKRYYATDVGTKYGVLTNGVQYLFFADTQHQNIMDDAPFYEMNLANPKEEDKNILSHFKKESLMASEMGIPVFVEKMNIKNYLLTQFAEPSTSFIEFLKTEVQAQHLTDKEIVNVIKQISDKKNEKNMEETNTDMMVDKQGVDLSSIHLEQFMTKVEDEGFEQVGEAKIKTVVSDQFRHRRLGEGKEQHSIFLPSDYQDFMMQYCKDNHLTKHEFINAILKDEEQSLNGIVSYDSLNCVIQSNEKRPWTTICGGIQNTIYFVPEIMGIVKESMKQNHCTKSEPVIYALEQFMKNHFKQSVAV